MIQKVFLDTNVVIDLMINREPFVREAEEIFAMKDTYNYDLVISALTIANLASAIDRLNKKPHELIARLLPFVETIALTSSAIEETVVSIFPDFEDGLQHSSALAAKADVIVTRNVKDFKQSLIPVMLPQQFVDMLTKH